MKILKPICAGVAGIFFPIGKPEDGGTCQYASDKCLKLCYALKKDYDETLNILEEDKKKIHQFFVDESVLAVCNEVIKEMDELQATILSWFSSGDCLDKDADRLLEVMGLLHDERVIQNGFTRNERFYRDIIEQDKLNHIVLTVESEKADDSPHYMGKYTKKLWAIPNYKTGVVNLYYGRWGSHSKKSYGGCGYNEVTVTDEFEGKEIAIASNCFGCYKKKIGCFMEFKGQ